MHYINVIIYIFINKRFVQLNRTFVRIIYTIILSDNFQPYIHCLSIYANMNTLKIKNRGDTCES